MTDESASTADLVVVEPEMSGTRALPYVGVVAGTAIAVGSLVLQVWPAVLVGGVLGAGSGVAGRNTFSAAWRWKKPDIVLPSSIPMEEAIELRYRRHSRKLRDVSSAELRVTLTCEEEVKWQESTRNDDGGSSTTTETRASTVYTEDFLGSISGTADGLEGVVTLGVPATVGAPSFAEENNTVRWFVDAELHGSGMPAGRHRFPVTVAPILGGASRGVQDT